MELRASTSGESRAIEELFTRVFSDSESESEGHLIGNLVKELLSSTPPEDLIAFVALEGDEIIGAICMTRMRTEKEANFFLLSPVAVATKKQRMGVGQKLINYGIEQLKERGVKVLVTYGDPRFYVKTGFQQITEETIQPPQKLSQPEGWLAQSLDGTPLQRIEGKFSCAHALDDPKYW